MLTLYVNNVDCPRIRRVLEVYQQMRGLRMLVIVGLIVLLVAAIARSSACRATLGRPTR